MLDGKLTITNESKQGDENKISCGIDMSMLPLHPYICLDLCILNILENCLTGIDMSMLPLHPYICLDYVDEWVHIKGEQSSGGPGGAIDPYSSLFSKTLVVPCGKLYEERTRAQAMSSRIAPLPELAMEAPIDALVGHHSGLVGPGMGPKLRVEAAQRLNKSVHAALVCAVEGGDPLSCVLSTQASSPILNP